MKTILIVELYDANGDKISSSYTLSSIDWYVYQIGYGINRMIVLYCYKGRSKEVSGSYGKNMVASGFLRSNATGAKR